MSALACWISIIPAADGWGAGWVPSWGAGALALDGPRVERDEGRRGQKPLSASGCAGATAITSKAPPASLVKVDRRVIKRRSSTVLVSEGLGG